MMTPVSRRVPLQWNGGEIWPRINPNSLYETLGIADSLGSTFGIEAALVDALAIADTAGTAWVITAATDALAISDSAGAGLTLRVAAADSLAVSDSAGSMQVASTADTLAIGEALGATIYRPILVADTLAINDSSQPILFAAAVDTLTLSDSAGAILALRVSAADTLAISDSVLDAPSTQRIVVMNVDTGAVSEYVLPVAVTGMTQRNGVLYLATSDGLFALDATDDRGDDVVWQWRTGVTHLGTDKLKRVIDVNALCRTQGAVIADVVTTREGEKRVDYYQLPAVVRDSHRDAVIKVGKGLSSAYWGFGLQGTTPAECHEIRISALELSRRR
jgi:hypothetical protein